MLFILPTAVTLKIKIIVNTVTVYCQKSTKKKIGICSKIGEIKTDLLSLASDILLPVQTKPSNAGQKKKKKSTACPPYVFSNYLW